MKILFIGSNPKHTFGSASVSMEISVRLKEKGFSTSSASKYSNRLVKLVDMVSHVLLRTKNIDVGVIDVFSGNAFIWARVVGSLLWLLRKPFLLVLRGGNLPAFATRHRKGVSSLLSQGAAVIAPSGYLRDELSTISSRIVVIPNPIDVSVYPQRLIETPRPRLLWMRAMHEIYNPRLAIDVLYLLREKYPDIRLEMVGPDKGDGTYVNLKRQASELRILDRTTIRGAVEKRAVPRLLAAHDIFLNTSNIDNTPVSVMEAMASGLCIVSTNVGGIPYLLKDEADSLLVPPDNPEQMANAVRTLLETPDLARRLSANARKKVEQFDYSVIVPKWEKLILDVSRNRFAKEGKIAQD